jgi:hypothetical protein
MEETEREGGVLPASQRGLLRSNSWGPPILWGLCGIFVLISVIALLSWLTRGREPRELAAMFEFAFFALILGRVAALGFKVEDQGILARTMFRTYRWRWDEIAGFDLRGTVYTPSLRVTLKDGTERGIVGLAARTKGEKERAERIFAELNRRLEIEHGFKSSTAVSQLHKATELRRTVLTALLVGLIALVVGFLLAAAFGSSAHGQGIAQPTSATATPFTMHPPFPQGGWEATGRVLRSVNLGGQHRGTVEKRTWAFVKVCKRELCGSSSRAARSTAPA